MRLFDREHRAPPSAYAQVVRRRILTAEAPPPSASGRDDEAEPTPSADAPPARSSEGSRATISLRVVIALCIVLVGLFWLKRPHSHATRSPRALPTHVEVARHPERKEVTPEGWRLGIRVALSILILLAALFALFSVTLPGRPFPGLQDGVEGGIGFSDLQVPIAVTLEPRAFSPSGSRPGPMSLVATASPTATVPKPATSVTAAPTTASPTSPLPRPSPAQ